MTLVCLGQFALQSVQQCIFKRQGIRGVTASVDVQVTVPPALCATLSGCVQRPRSLEMPALEMVSLLLCQFLFSGSC